MTKREDRTATATRPRVQLHVWVDADVAEWVWEQSVVARVSRGKIVEGFLRERMPPTSAAPRTGRKLP